MKKWLERIRFRHLVITLFILSFAVSLQCYLISIGQEYTRYNNYVIFVSSFENLVNHVNLFAPHPELHFDLFKYSPSFALCMGVFYWMPDWLGLFLFNFLNLGVFLYGMVRIGFAQEKLKWMLLFLFVEIGISLSSSQTNLLIAGFIMLAFACMEEDKPFIAALLIASTVFIKIFGLVAFSLFLLYPKRFRFAIYSAFWSIVIAALPLMVESWGGLVQQYQNWWTLLQADASASIGLSFAGWMSGMFGLYLPKTPLVLVAAGVFCLPLLRIRDFESIYFRLMILASILLWVVIFNHRGESPTYVIAMAGVAIWYFTQLRSPINLTLLWLCVVFTSLSSTDAVTPLWIQAKYVDPYSLKAVFCCVVWFKLIGELMTGNIRPDPAWRETPRVEARP